MSHEILATRRGLAIAAVTLFAIGCSTNDTPGDPPWVAAYKADGYTDPDVYGGGSDSSSSSSGGDTDIVVAPTVSFYIETKSGKNLQGVADQVTLSLDEDKYDGPADPKFQLDVIAQTTDAEGGTVTVKVDGKLAGSGTVSGNTAKIAKVTIECASNAQLIEVEVTAGGKTAKQQKKVKLECGLCDAQILKPAASCLTVDADPNTVGFQQSFKVTSTSLTCNEAAVALVKGIGTPAAETAYVKLTQVGQLMEATIVVTIAGKDSGWVGQTATVKAKVRNTDEPGQTEGESLPLDVKVTTEAPAITIVTPTADKLTLADDTDDGVAGVQLKLKGTVTTVTLNDTDKIRLLIDGKETLKTTADAQQSFEFDLSFDQTKTYKVAVEATNECGLTSTKEVTFQVFVDKAQLTITDPAAKAVLLAKDDQDKKTELVYETDFVIGFKEAQVGSTIGVYCQANVADPTFAGAAVGSTVVTANVVGASVPVAIDVAAIGTDIVCIARDDGANQAESAIVQLTVALPAPCMKLTQPDQDVVTNAASLPVTVTADNFEGAKVTASVQLVGGAEFITDKALGTVTQSAVSSPLLLSTGNPVVPLPDGSYVLTVAAKDGFGNKASDSACSELQRNFKVDRTPPSLDIASPATLTIDPITVPDSNPNVDGYQTVVVVNYTGEPLGDTVEVCLTVGTFKVGCKEGVTGSVTFDSVSLQSGLNTLAATATDDVGNVTPVAKLKVINFVSDAVTVNLVDPISDTAVAKPEVTIKVRVLKKGVPLSGAAAAMHLDGKVHADAVINDDGDGYYTAVITNLNKGKNALRFVALPGNAAQGFSQTLNVLYKTDLPTVQIDSPAANSALNRASTACVAGNPDCVLKTVTVSTANAADGSKVTVTADCGGTSKPTATGTVASSKMTLTQKLTLPNNSTCALTAVVTDEAGQKATSKAVTVTIDRTAPVFKARRSPAGSKLFSDSDLDKNKAGVQLLFQLQMCGLPKESAVTCNVVDDDGKAAGTLKSLAHADIPEACGQLSFGVVSFPDGEKIKVSCTTADSVGNPASYDFSLIVLADAAEIRFISPLYVAESSCSKTSDCTGQGVCVGGKCALAMGAAADRTVAFAVFGAPSGTKVRVCTNGTATAGAANCASSGYKVVVESTVSQASNVTAQLDALVDGTHRLVGEMEDPKKPGTWVLTTNVPSGTEQFKYRRLLLDTVAPVVSAVVAPAGKDAPLGCLNRAAQSQDDLTAGGMFPFTATANEQATITLFLSGNSVGSAAAEANTPVGIPVTLAAEGAAKLSAVATDIVGNQSAVFQVKTGKAIEDFSFQVNTVPPSKLSFTAPNKSPLIIGDSLDVSLNGADTDTAKQPVTLFDGGTAKAPVQKLANSVVSYKHADYGTLSDGNHQLTAQVKDTCGNATTVATSPATIAVDTQAPTATISAPANKANFGDGDDADKTVGGYQVKVTYATSGAKTWKLELGTDCDANFANCKHYPQIASGNVTNDGGSEPDRSFNIPFGVAAEYSIRLTATDSNGNKTVATSGFKVVLSGCLVAMSGQPQNGILNTENCATKGQNCANVALDMKVEHIGPCGTPDSVKLIKIDGAGKETEVASAVPSNNVADFKGVKFDDGDDIKVEARVFESAAQKGSSGPTPLLVDLTNPVATFVAATVDGFSTPASGAAVVWGKAGDLDAAKSNHQFNARLKVSDVNINTGSITKLQTIVATVEADLVSSAKLPIVFSTSGDQLADIKLGSVVENKKTTVRATVRDAANNTSTAQFTVTVDWIAPGKLTLAAFEAADINPRRPYAKLNFTSVADDGTAGEPATGYEVRYSRSNIATATDFDNACDAAKLTSSTIDPPKLPGQGDLVMIEGPDPRDPADPCKFVPLTDNGVGKWYFSARAVDAAGNKGAIATAISTADIRLRYAKISGTNAPVNNANSYAYVSSIGDINGDGLTDIKLGGPVNWDFCVVYGHANADMTVDDMALSGSSSAIHQCIAHAKPRGYQVLHDIDVNGDGVHDVVVSEAPGPGTLREVRVYLGEKDKTLTETAAAIITNLSAGSSQGILALGNGGNFNGDKSGAGEAIDDIVFTTQATASVPYDRVMIVPGSAAWKTSAPVTIDIENAAHRAANNVATVHLVNPNASASFGITVTTVRNVLPDGDGTGEQYDDLAIGQNYAPQQVILLKGQKLAGEVVFALTPTPPASPAGADLKVVHLWHADKLVLDRGFANAAPIEWDGDGKPDLLLLQHLGGSGHPAVYWIRGKYLADHVGKAGVKFGASETKAGNGMYKLASDWGFGRRMWVDTPFETLGNFFDVTGGGVAIGGKRPTWAPGGRATVTFAGLFVRPEFEAGTNPTYAYDDVSAKNPFAPTKTTFGNYFTSPVTDFNGDGFPDLLVGTGEAHTVLIY